MIIHYYYYSYYSYYSYYHYHYYFAGGCLGRLGADRLAGGPVA